MEQSSEQISVREQASRQNIALLKASFWEAQRPDPVVTVSEWADKHRYLSPVASAEPGIYRTSRTPYLKEIMDHCSTSSLTREIVLKKGSQVGFSECALCWIGYVMDRSPGPSMIIQPNEKLAKRFSKQRVDAMIRDTPQLQKKVREKKSRDSSNTVEMKEFDGGLLVISGANSSVNLRSMPIKNLFLDEIDGYSQDVDGEGDPVDLAVVRTRTFPRRKILKGSSPTTEAKSRITKAYNETDKRRYYVPCPHCDHYQTIEWPNIKWERGRPETAHMECTGCKGQIHEFHKTKMLERGEWRATAKAKKKRVVGYQLSALYSPVGWYSWADAANDFLKAKDDPLKLQVFVNTVLGEEWKEKGEAPDWERLFERRELYPVRIVPPGGLFLTAGVDVQGDRFEMEITAWGKDKQSWSIDYRVEYCDTAAEGSYQVLDALLNETFEVAGSKTRLGLRMLAIDSGHNTQAVYHWCRKNIGRAVPVKGRETQPTIVSTPTYVDVSYGGKKIPNGVRLWKVGTSVGKSELYGWLGLKKPTREGEPYPPGYCHFPQYAEGFFKMLTAEQLVIKQVRGYRRYVWEQTGRNEALDCRIYSRAAACIVGLDRYTDADWKQMEDALHSKQASVAPVKTKGGIPVKESDYW